MYLYVLCMHVCLVWLTSLCVCVKIMQSVFLSSLASQCHPPGRRDIPEYRAWDWFGWTRALNSQDSRFRGELLVQRTRVIETAAEIGFVHTGLAMPLPGTAPPLAPHPLQLSPRFGRSQAGSHTPLSHTSAPCPMMDGFKWHHAPAQLSAPNPCQLLPFPASTGLLMSRKGILIRGTVQDTHVHTSKAILEGSSKSGSVIWV